MSRASARAVVEEVATGFEDLDVPRSAEPDDGPIEWPGYRAAREAAEERTGEDESVLCGTAKIGDVEAVVIAFEFGFLGGSIGQRTGDRVEAAFARAVESRLPVVSLIATGGSRMQHGMRALSQLQRIARAAAGARSVPQISVLRDPTTGGGWATLGASADVVLALPEAQVGFAGSRVRPADAPAEAYTAEAKLAWGQVDRIVPPADLPATLERWLRLLTSPTAEAAEPPGALGSARLPQSGWAAVQAARAADRPRAAEYLDAYFDWREDVSGDRCGGVDSGVLCGFGWRDGRAIAYAAQCGTPTLPAGFRTAARLVRLASRLGIPVLTLVDTPGAANDAEAERAGAGAAIAELFEAVASAAVPITTLVIGEGGSGGALAFAAPGSTWVTPGAYFSVTSPEAAAAILKLPADEVPALADRLRLRPQDLVALGIARSVVGPADRV
ncbi:carboxyl transferase domain-containing protein [Amycolatopsis azurea]|uniref:Acetyl-coenzyme A carboxylase carboxyl transferase subunits beta/alpha n=1 Tax=Amycolatopsis azurea DSM 43854 TaxID=1238180 RepID=M2PUK6_9PSEU|nr:carboxyl transferase domain-containing protein [Amycolatopsis azurea]EMD28308.1 Acetyl-coenzyme A carboxyl transferase [Amycolatopsis azurea DSM 43854]OOC04965.1 acetyl-CoA carboxylase [Amycolatopsis azurea DSM 43854]